MEPSIIPSSPPSSAPFPASRHPRGTPPLWQDRLRLGALLGVVLLLGYQLAVTMLAPPWAPLVTGWFRAALAWPEVFFLLFLSGWLTRRRRPEALSWWLLSVSLLGYAVGKTLLVVAAQFVFPQQVPFPWWSDGFYLLTLPCFSLAIVLWPGVLARRQARLTHVKMLLDLLLVMGAAAALSWYFLLAPLAMATAPSGLARAVSLAYPVLDLGGCFALAVVLLRRDRPSAHSVVLWVLLGATVCLIVADSWMAWIRLYGPSSAGAYPDLLFLLASLLLPLAGLAQYRSAKHAPVASAEPHVAEARERSRWRDLRGCLRFLFPLVAVLVASIILEARMIVAPIPASGVLVPHLIILLLFLLVLARQGVAFLELARVQREREAARISEQALRESNRQMETFLGIASHELKTPLSTMLLSLQLLQRGTARSARPVASPEQVGTTRGVTAPGALVELTLEQLGRLQRLVNDLVDCSRIQAEHLKCQRQPADLTTIVREAVEEQRLGAPERTILLCLPEEQPVPVWGDAARLGQVVTNYLTNALKYSREDRPVEVGLHREDWQGRVWVRDEGPGIPQSEQAYLWERFHRVPGIEVQSGSGVGLGLGLHISKTIIELHQGQVGVESTLGQGATFWFTLPLTAPGVVENRTAHR